MDQAEKGTLHIVVVPGTSNRLHHLLLLASLLLSMMAFSAAAFACMQLSSDYKEREGRPQSTAYVDNTPTESLVTSSAEHIEQWHRSTRSLSTEICNSTLTSTTLPSAHIIYGVSSSKYTIPAPSSSARQVIISKNWACNKANTIRTAGGFVQGGMSYSKETGFLLLPVDGVYFVYSQVMFSATDMTSGQAISMGHRTVVCRPEDSSCGPSTPLLETMSYPARAPDGSALSSFYHGGLLSATAGTQIGVAGWYDTKLQDRSLQIDMHWSHSYLGAFLVHSPTNNFSQFD